MTPRTYTSHSFHADRQVCCGVNRGQRLGMLDAEQLARLKTFYKSMVESIVFVQASHALGIPLDSEAEMPACFVAEEQSQPALVPAPPYGEPK